MTKAKTGHMKVVIDGYELAEIKELSLDRDINAYGPFLGDYIHGMYNIDSGRTRIELSTIDDIDFAFNLQYRTLTSNEAYEIVDEDGIQTIYVYGPLRRLIPSLFVGKDLLEWQKAYLDASHQPKYYQYKLMRDDPVFSTDTAMYFSYGYDRGYATGNANGYRAGYEKSRKDETINATTEQQTNNRKRR